MILQQQQLQSLIFVWVSVSSVQLTQCACLSSCSGLLWFGEYDLLSVVDLTHTLYLCRILERRTSHSSKKISPSGEM